MRVLFVCTGNVCRSPMAAALAAAVDPSLSTASAGTRARPHQPSTPEAVAVMAEVGIDLSGHRSRRIVDPIPSPDLVLAVAEEHRTTLLRCRPEWAPIVELLDPAGGCIPDPYGGDLDDYRRTRTLLARAVTARFS